MTGVNAQTLIFLQSLLLGAALGALYDIFRVLRLAAPAPPALVCAQDLLYSLLCALATFWFMMQSVYGQVRFFVLIGEAIGGAVYHVTVGAAVVKAAQAVFSAVERALRLLCRAILAPLYRQFCRIGGKIKAPLIFLRQKTGKFARILKIRLKRQSPLLYNQSNKTIVSGNQVSVKSRRGNRLEERKKGNSQKTGDIS
ncbi:MAG: spore cortex biosynthesis protein YabQ [Oscillospiraceae bacterium]|nr:spore cortex biosynthesis protein YabQ [Oscillospiraceae bacterium]